MKKIPSIFLIVILIFPFLAQANSPTIVSVLLNGKAETVTFRAISGKDKPLSIELTADQPVKFNTIAICSVSVNCTRTTAVKYFTQTDPSLSVAKNWDGKTGGSNPQVVSDGEYKISVTLGLSGVTSTFTQELSQKIIVSSVLVDGDTDTSTESTDNTIVTDEDSGSDIFSVHTSEVSISDYRRETIKIGAGRERLATARTPILFSVSQNKVGKNNHFIWSFGDGTSAVGNKVYHTYQFPDRYNVVLNGSIDNEEEGVARTIVLVSEPDLKITSVNLPAGYVEVINNSNREQNLNSWGLRIDEKIHVFPLDTIISSKSSIKIPLTAIGLNSSDAKEISLVYPDGAIASQLNLSPEQVALQLVELKKQLAKVKKQIAEEFPETNYSSPVIFVKEKTTVEPKPVNVVTLKKESGWFGKIKNALLK